jgi:putative transposase
LRHAGWSMNAKRAQRILRQQELKTLADVMIMRGPPAYIRSDNGPEFIAMALREWIAAVGFQAVYIASGSPWENGCYESFNIKLRDKLLDGEIPFSPPEAQIPIKAWRQHYNGVRPHSSGNYRPPAPESFIHRSGGTVPWASATAVKGVRSPAPDMALETAMRSH